MEIRKPFNLLHWIEENRGLLKPPVGNKNIYTESGDFIVMVVGGPNARKDYHYNETDEFFYQLEGSIQVAIQTEKGKEIITLNAGDVYLIPAKIPHSPMRSEGSVGLVIESKRAQTNIQDGLLWYCDHCNEKLHEVYFPLKNIETDFLSHFKTFYTSKELRTCKNCGEVMEADARFIG
nr:3-hydroxyanthranilate 3,4-dioxygenase [uncultured Flavobacterium sp.]